MIDKRNREILPVLKLVRAYAGRWMPNKDERDDIVQTVMLKLLTAKIDISRVPKGYCMPLLETLQLMCSEAGGI